MNNPFEILETRLSNIENLLLDIKHSGKDNHNIPEADQFLTVQDTANFLSLSVPTVYGLISKGQLPVMKRSKRCYFSKIDLINYLKEGRKKTLSELANDADNFLIKNKKR